MKSEASFKTNRGGRYLKALCHHFGRKVEAECTDTEGRVLFPFGRCEMTADTEILQLSAFAADRQKLAQVIEIITNHFERFAFREDPMLEWQVQNDPSNQLQNLHHQGAEK